MPPTQTGKGLQAFSQADLDQLIYTTAARLNRDAGVLEHALAERERRGDDRQLALTAAAYAWLAAGESVLPRATH